MTDSGARRGDLEALAALLREIGGNSKWSTWSELLTSEELAKRLLARGVSLGAALTPQHNCQEWREAIAGCANCHKDYYAALEAAEARGRAALTPVGPPLEGPNAFRAMLGRIIDLAPCACGPGEVCPAHDLAVKLGDAYERAALRGERPVGLDAPENWLTGGQATPEIPTS